MKNEGIKNGIIEIAFAAVMFLLMRILPTEAYSVLLFAVVGVVGWFYYRKQSIKREFPAVFTKPDSQQYAIISEYFERVQQEAEAKNKSMAWQYYVIIPAYLFFTLQIAVWSLKYKAFLFFPITLIILLIIACLAMVLTNYVYNPSQRVEKVSSSDFEIARVEFFDASYSHYGKNVQYNYYVFVRYNGEELKLKVSKFVYGYALSQQCGVGYLIKNPNGYGIYDVLDFVPENEVLLVQ